MFRTAFEFWAAASVSTLFLAAIATTSARADTFLYVSQAPEQAIRIYRMNDADGSLADVETVAVDGTPGASSVDQTGKFLFVSLRSTSKIGSFRIDGGTGKLTLVNTTQLVGGANAAYVRTDRTGKFLFSASYAGGRVVVHALDSEGRIGAEPLEVIETAKTAHCVAVDAANQIVYVPHVAPNVVYQFRFNAATGQLAPLEDTVGGSVNGQVPGGRNSPDGKLAGPRHLAFHPTGKAAFTSDESGSSVSMYGVFQGRGLIWLSTFSTLPADYRGKNTTAEVKAHPSGKFLWVSNRGHDSLAGFEYLGRKEGLKPLGQTPTEPTPRSFDIDPSGRFLFAAGEGSGKLQAYAIDETTGRLTPTKKYDVGKSLTWVTASKLK